MFSLYKNVISGNFIVQEFQHDGSCKTKSKDDQVFMFSKPKLFSLPKGMPFINPPAAGHDTLFPPFNSMYIEEDVHLTLKTENIGQVSEHRGCFIRFLDFQNKKEIAKAIEYDNNLNRDDVPKGARFVVSCICYIMEDGNAHLIKPFNPSFLVSENGDLMDLDLGGVLENEYIKTWSDWIFSFLRFINLSNITMESLPLRKKTIKHFKRHKSNQTRYRILKVHKPSVNKKSNTIGNEEISMPLHQVRGHLADYTKGNGLFGKYKIRIWIPDHFRGDLKYGKSEKDYIIEKAKIRK